MTTKILIEDEGEFHLDNDNLPELIEFLNDKNAVKDSQRRIQMQEIINNDFKGLELLRD